MFSPRRSLATLALAALLPLGASGQWYTFKLDTQTPHNQQVIPDSFEGNTPYLRAEVYENGLGKNFSNLWDMTFWYSKDAQTKLGVQIPGTWSSSNVCDFMGATNVFFRAGKYYFSVVGIHHTSASVKTFGRGTMYQSYDPGADTNIQTMLGQVNTSWWTNSLGRQVTSNTAAIAVIQTGKLAVVTWNAGTNAIIVRIASNETVIASLLSGTSTWWTVTNKLNTTAFNWWSNLISATNTYFFNFLTNHEARLDVLEAQTGTWNSVTGKVSVGAFNFGSNLLYTLTQAGVTNITVTEGTSNLVVITGQTAAFTIKTNYTAGTDEGFIEATLASGTANALTFNETTFTLTLKTNYVALVSTANGTANAASIAASRLTITFKTNYCDSVTFAQGTANAVSLVGQLLTITFKTNYVAEASGDFGSNWWTYPAKTDVQVESNDIVFVQVNVTTPAVGGYNFATNYKAATAYTALAGYAVSNAFDGEYASGEFYRTSGGTDGAWWIKYDAGATIVASSYRIRGYASLTYHYFAPSNWNFYASVNGAAWTLLVSETAKCANLVAGKVYTSAFANTTAYRYYLWTNIVSSGGGRIHVPLIEVLTSGTAEGKTTNTEYYLRGPSPYDGSLLTGISGGSGSWVPWANNASNFQNWITPDTQRVHQLFARSVNVGGITSAPPTAIYPGNTMLEGSFCSSEHETDLAILGGKNDWQTIWLFQTNSWRGWWISRYTTEEGPLQFWSAYDAENGLSACMVEFGTWGLNNWQGNINSNQRIRAIDVKIGPTNVVTELATKASTAWGMSMSGTVYNAAINSAASTASGYDVTRAATQQQTNNLFAQRFILQLSSNLAIWAGINLKASASAVASTNAAVTLALAGKGGLARNNTWTGTNKFTGSAMVGIGTNAPNVILSVHGDAVKIRTTSTNQPAITITTPSVMVPNQKIISVMRGASEVASVDEDGDLMAVQANFSGNVSVDGIVFDSVGNLSCSSEDNLYLIADYSANDTTSEIIFGYNSTFTPTYEVGRFGSAGGLFLPPANGTNMVAAKAGYAGIFCASNVGETVAELWTVDSAGTYTKQTSHEQGRHVAESYNQYTGKGRVIDLDALAQAVEIIAAESPAIRAKLKQAGIEAQDIYREITVPRRDWDADERARVEEEQAEYDQATVEYEAAPDKADRQRPTPPKAQRPVPTWIKEATK